MITKDGRDTPIEKLTADNYIVPKGEEKDYHAVIEVVQFDQKTGKRISQPRVQKFGKKIFEAHVLNSLRKQGYTVTILHNPNVWLKEQAAKAEQAKAEAEQAKAQAEQEKFDAAVDKAVSERVDAAVAKALAEQAAKAEQAKAEQSDKKPGPGRPPKDQKEAPEQGSQSK
jgi:hypothetical protein